jgi:N-hydroxyarylamine O-acetyltransferase
MQLDAYLQRIGHEGEVRPDLATLKALHRAHLLAIPYETFDVQFQRPVDTDPAKAYAKIVEGRRGGWCYEMNGLFGWALEAAGFKVTRLAGGGTDPASHLVLRVDLGETWIADVGFGDGPIAPFRLQPGAFEQRGFTFGVEAHDDGRWRLNNHKYGLAKFYDWGGPDEAAMAERCHRLQTAPDSTFVQNAVAVRHTPDGVISLIGRILRTVRPDGVPRILIESADEYVAVLKDRFDLDLPQAADLWPAICRRHEEVMAAQAEAKAAAAMSAQE